MKQLSGRDKQDLRRLLGSRCRQARERLGLSGRRAARELGMSGSWIREVESGRQWAPAWYLVILAEAIDAPMTWFFGFGTSARRLPNREASYSGGEKLRAFVLSLVQGSTYEAALEKLGEPAGVALGWDQAAGSLVDRLRGKLDSDLRSEDAQLDRWARFVSRE